MLVKGLEMPSEPDPLWAAPPGSAAITSSPAAAGCTLSSASRIRGRSTRRATSPSRTPWSRTA
eukprot:425877-Lingulodinium_polyedra.AAC.1